MRINAATPKSQQAQLATAAQAQIYSGYGYQEGAGYDQGYGYQPQPGQQQQWAAPGYAPSASPAPGSSHQIDPNDPNNTTIFIGGLDPNVDENGLRAAFQSYGELTYVRVPPGKNCGFVQYAYRAHAEAALDGMTGQFIGNQRVRLSWGRSAPGGAARPAQPAQAPPPPPAQAPAATPAAPESAAQNDQQWSQYYQQEGYSQPAAAAAPEQSAAAPDYSSYYANTNGTVPEKEVYVSDIIDDYSKPYDVSVANDVFLAHRSNLAGAAIFGSELYDSLDGMTEE